MVAADGDVMRSQRGAVFGAAHIVLGAAADLLEALSIVFFEGGSLLKEQGEFLNPMSERRVRSCGKGRGGHTLAEAILCLSRFSNVAMPICKINRQSPPRTPRGLETLDTHLGRQDAIDLPDELWARARRLVTSRAPQRAAGVGGGEPVKEQRSPFLCS